MEECADYEDNCEKEKTAATESEGVIHRDITENKEKNNQYIMRKVIEEFPDDITPADMEKCVNYEDNVDKEKTAENKNEGVISRYIKENEKETNRNTL